MSKNEKTDIADKNLDRKAENKKTVVPKASRSKAEKPQITAESKRKVATDKKAATAKKL